MKHGSFVGMVVATFGFVGYVPIAPGTAGSLGAFVIYVPMRGIASPWAAAIVIAIVFAAGVWAASIAEQVLGRKDPGPVVIDEVLGMLLTLAWQPLSWTGVAAGFFLFRLFDIVKPFPARQSEAAPGGLGVMLDDAVAGVYGHLALRALGMVWPAWILA